MSAAKFTPYIQICSLEAAREADLEAFDGVITIEDSQAENPFRISGANPTQCILRFDDITVSNDEWITPRETHVRAALNFARGWASPSLLIHCHAGMSRSPAIALAILADSKGLGFEDDAVNELISISRLSMPNKLIIEIADQILERSGRLISAWERNE